MSRLSSNSLNVPASSSGVRPALRTAALCAGLFAGTVLLFSRGLGYGFSNYDDPSYITNNAHVQAGFTWESLRWAFAGRADYWHPLTWLSHMLDWQLYGDNASGHHLTSVLWHALNAVLAFVVVRRLTGAFWTSAFGAALFAWHPLRVESVVWITERKDVMSGCFFLLTVWAYAAYVRRKAGTVSSPPSEFSVSDLSRPAGRFYLLALALFFGGLMCKPMLVAVPVVLLILDVWPLRRIDLTAPLRSWGPNAARLALEKLPFFVLSAVTSVVTVLMQQDKGAFVLDLPLAARLGNAAVSVARYLGKLFWPVDLTVVYPHPGYWPAAAVLGATALIIVLTAAGWRQRGARPWILAGWLGFLAALLPASGIVQVGFQAMADRYTYVPVIALQFALLWTLRDLPWLRRHGWQAASAAGVVLLGCAGRTWNQQATWRDPATLFRHALAVTERNDVAHALLGYTLAGLRQTDEALLHARRALELNPRNETARFTIARVHEQNGDLDAAIATYRQILEFNPGDAESDYRAGLLLLRLGRNEEAHAHLRSAARTHPELVQRHVDAGMAELLHARPQLALGQFQTALALNPDEPTAHFGAGLALAQLERNDDAIRHHETAVRLRPNYPEARAELGLLLLSRGLPAEAEPHFVAALKTSPRFALAHLGLGRCADQLGRMEEAAASFERALEFAPNEPAVHRALAQSLGRRQRFDDAARHYRRAVELKPHDAELHAELGYVLVLAGRRADGLRAWRTALELDPAFPGLRERLERLEQQ